MRRKLWPTTYSQRQNPTSPTYKLLSLCQKIDSAMPDSTKVEHILKEIADNAYNLLVFRNCGTVEAVVDECPRFEQARNRHITRNFQRLPNNSATSSCESTTSLSEPSTEEITQTVRHELEAMLPPDLAPHMATMSSSSPSSLSMAQAMVRQEIAHYGVSKAQCPPYHIPLNQIHPPVSAPIFSQRPRQDRTACHTPDDRPICAHCKAVGHISRYSPRHWPFCSRYSFPLAPASPFTDHTSTRCCRPSGHLNALSSCVLHRSTSRCLSCSHHTSTSPPPLRFSSLSPHSRKTKGCSFKRWRCTRRDEFKSSRTNYPLNL